MKRRSFLQLGAVASSFSLLNSTKSFAHTVKPSKVIVLGAGFSGLSAALTLFDKKVDFVVLESRNRIGGRVFTHKIDEQADLRVELGAEWVGDSHEEVKKLCERFKIKLNDNRFETDLYFRGKYSTVKRWDFDPSWQKKLEKLLEEFKNLNPEQQKQFDRLDWWRYLVNNGIPENDLFFRELLDSTDFGESIRHVSAFAAISEYAYSSKKNEMDFKMEGGNNTLSDKIADYIGREKILTDHHVEAVIQSGKGVTVKCSNGKIFTADKIICTVPTFSLGQINFSPSLPKATLHAIDALQYARINKCVGLYSQRFWKREDFDMITDTPAHYFYHATKNQDSIKGALTSYTIGEKADIFGWQNDESRKQIITDYIHPIGNARNLLQKIVNYNWGQDKYSKGAYAIYGTGQWFTIQPLLKKHHLNVHFAGEHLAEWQGFMEGAIITGRDAVNEILN
ncbi:flavin monoamine oxidase family protein [Emticicia sp. SJ17W-69]|uniref:flavin monoamine oxidase family protein n=1 Tax=Emticicia sp. SJ17W-69 TaxID=3421657 RepID=UPI003EBC7FF1